MAYEYRLDDDGHGGLHLAQGLLASVVAV